LGEGGGYAYPPPSLVFQGIGMNKSRFSALLFLFAITVAGCASTPDVKPLLWPPLPAEPKIAYVKSLKGESDLREKSFFDKLLGSEPEQGLGKAYGVFARDSRIYVTITAGAYVQIFDEKERQISIVAGEGEDRLALPIGVAVSSDGTLYVTDAKKKGVFGFDSKGKLRVSIWKKGEFQNPAGLAINDELGRLYVVDSFGHAVHAYTLQGKKLFQFGTNGNGDGEFYYPTNIAVDRRNGKLYVVDTQNFRVQVFDQDGKFIKKFGELNDTLGTFSRPKGIGVDTEGHVYVVDAAFENFQIFDEDGQLLLFLGAAGDAPGFFNLPAGMYVDENDRIYVVDSLNRRVQVFQYLSEKWKKDHSEEYQKLLQPQAGDGQK